MHCTVAIENRGNSHSQIDTILNVRTELRSANTVAVRGVCAYCTQLYFRTMHYAILYIPAECKIHTLWINVLSTHLWVYDVTVVNIDVVLMEDT